MDRSKGFLLLQGATKQLRETLGQSGVFVMASWDQKDDENGRRKYNLKLSDWTGTVNATFSLDELRAYSQDRYPWHRLWGDLLLNRSRRQLAELSSGNMLVRE